MKSKVWKRYLLLANVYNRLVGKMHEASGTGNNELYYSINQKMDKYKGMICKLLTEFYGGHTKAFIEDMVVLTDLESEIIHDYIPNKEYLDLLPAWKHFRDVDYPVTAEEEKILSEKRSDIELLVAERELQHWWSQQPDWAMRYDKDQYRYIHDRYYSRSFFIDSDNQVRIDDINGIQLIEGISKHGKLRRNKRIEGTGYKDQYFSYKDFKPGKIYALSSRVTTSTGKERFTVSSYALIKTIDLAEQVIECIKVTDRLAVILLFPLTRIQKELVKLDTHLEQIRIEKGEARQLSKSYRQTELFRKAGGLLDTGGWNYSKLKKEERKLRNKRDNVLSKIGKIPEQKLVSFFAT
ncbi:MAG: hypothetical protein ACFFD4_34080 [Candidatus Odinarchaeota archaeon]